MLSALGTHTHTHAQRRISPILSIRLAVPAPPAFVAMWRQLFTFDRAEADDAQRLQTLETDESEIRSGFVYLAGRHSYFGVGKGIVRPPFLPPPLENSPSV